jgi:16S rRNA (guanine(966)-N(2))-methyltransferase RsmD
MRIVAGRFGSRPLKSPRGRALRPTSDRLRETLFNILGSAVEGAVFVDVYAGTGAVGLEALSRGARAVIFVEQHDAAVRLIRANAETLGVSAEIEVLARDAMGGLAFLARRGLRPDFIFLDPPYAEDEEYVRVLEFLESSPLLEGGARIIVEHSRRTRLPERFGELERARVVEQGDAALSFYRRSNEATAREAS